ncbi:MAG: FlgD immunoglobulin-like domain containing protein [Candidatus Edwardsbacteria bacterium]|nr:FlgD immunoglobulin-like domain containing protein [Candidatus Edwardsbacteria bacterium]
MNREKVLGFLVMLVTITTSSFASQRVVVAEDFTGTWCQYCPAAANGLDQLYNETGDSLVVLAFHYGDPYQTTETYNRIVWYGDMIPGYPTVIFDGLDSIVGSAGSGAAYNNYDYYRPVFDAHKAVPSPFEITINLTSYDLDARTGTASIKIKNTGIISETGNFHFVVIERNIPQIWQGMTEVDFVVRDMIPNENGESITIPAGDSLVITRDYLIDPAWNFYKCQFVGFVQRSTKEIIQGSSLAGSYLVQKSYSLSGDDDGDGFNEPGETMILSVAVHNLGGPSPMALVEATTADTFVTINNSLWNIGPIGTSYQGDNVALPFEIVIKSSASMTEGHLVKIYIDKKSYNSLYNDTMTARDSVSFIIGAPTQIYAEDFEGGLGNWKVGYTAYTTGIDWDTTQTDYHSANTCIVNAESGTYANKQNRWIRMIDPLDLSSSLGAKLTWYEKYDVWSGDRCQPEVSTDSLGTTWSTLTAFYSGTVSAWTQRTLDITSYCGNKKFFRLGFRLLTDTINVADGWYVDDILITGYAPTGVAGKPGVVSAPATCLLKGAYPNPASGKVNIGFQLKSSARTSLKIYNIAGELVRTLVDSRLSSGDYDLRWDGRDGRNRAMPSGVYLYQLDAGSQKATGRLTLIR